MALCHCGCVRDCVACARLVQVKAVERHGRRVTKAQAGDVVTLSVAGMDMEHVKIGCIMCEMARPIPLASVFLAQIVVFDIDEPVTKGYQVRGRGSGEGRGG